MADPQKKPSRPNGNRNQRRRERRRERRQEARQQELRHLDPEERRERLRHIGRNQRRRGGITKKQAQQRREAVKDSGRVMGQRQWRRDRRQEKRAERMTPAQRARRIQMIKANEDLTGRQRANRIENVREGGRIADRPKKPTPVGIGPGIAPEHLSAYTILQAKFADYGLGSLAGKIRDLLMDGRSSAEIELELQETNEWKQRFKGNEMRRKNGLNVLSVSEYLAAENQYSQVMKNYGLPSGFYDDPEDYADFIGKSISPAEMEQRVTAWADLKNREDPAVVKELERRGIGGGDLLAFMIDPDRAMPVIQKKYQSTLVGAAARRTGLQAGTDYADKLAGMGVTEQQAGQVYGQIADALPTVSNLGEIYGTDISQSDLEQELFEGDAKSGRKRKTLSSQERASFSGQSGVGSKSLGRSSAGQY